MALNEAKSSAVPSPHLTGFALTEALLRLPVQGVPGAARDRPAARVRPDRVLTVLSDQARVLVQRTLVHIWKACSEAAVSMRVQSTQEHSFIRLEWATFCTSPTSQKPQTLAVLET